jgi:hypothetical protein
MNGTRIVHSIHLRFCRRAYIGRVGSQASIWLPSWWQIGSGRNVTRPYAAQQDFCAIGEGNAPGFGRANCFRLIGRMIHLLGHLATLDQTVPRLISHSPMLLRGRLSLSQAFRSRMRRLLHRKGHVNLGTDLARRRIRTGNDDVVLPNSRPGAPSSSATAATAPSTAASAAAGNRPDPYSEKQHTQDSNPVPPFGPDSKKEHKGKNHNSCS